MFAVELAPKVRVNAVLPGPVLLPESLSAEDRRRAIAGTLVGRPGRPENIALAVAGLLENDFITGAASPSTAAARSAKPADIRPLSPSLASPRR